MTSHFETKHLQSQVAYQYILKLFGQSQGITIELNTSHDQLFRIHPSADFEALIQNPKQQKAPNAEGIILSNDNTPDYLATAFYHINCLQEYQDCPLDDLNRFPYVNSLQHRHDNIQVNIGQYCFDQLAKELGIKSKKKKTRFFLTHDIDSVYGAILQDGFNVLKKGRIDIFFQLLFRAAIGKPDWLNMDLIMKLESVYDCKSVFYWLVNKGRLNSREINADYDFFNPKIQNIYKSVSDKGFENGIHKSISKDGFESELIKFDKKPIGNRYHYLKFNLPSGFDAIEESGLKLDSSLGFAEKMGFRNNYGLPFTPYNFAQKRPYSFVEVPLHIMDRTFFQYDRKSPEKATMAILDFLEKNKENCVLSILWHNNFFTDYKFKGYLKMYKAILEYICLGDFKTISQQEIIEDYLL